MRPAMVVEPSGTVRPLRTTGVCSTATGNTPAMVANSTNTLRTLPPWQIDFLKGMSAMLWSLDTLNGSGSQSACGYCLVDDYHQAPPKPVTATG